MRKAWSVSPLTYDHFVTVVPPQMRGGPEWFQGTADAVFQNLNLVYQHRPELVAVFGADHIYRMDIAQMVAFHLENGADVSIAALPVPREQGQSFGVIVTDSEGRIRDFQEKPAKPTPIPTDPSRCYASMGNYLFSADLLDRELQKSHDRAEKDFG